MKNLIITVTEDQIPNTDQIAAKLQEDGLHLSKVFPFGVITGAAEGSAVERFSQHKEIMSLEEDVPFQIPPPTANVQ